MTLTHDLPPVMHCAACADYLKCPLSLGWSLSNLAFAAVEYKPALVASGQWEMLMNILKWGTDWMIKGHVMASDTPSGNAFVGQVRLPAAVVWLLLLGKQ
jgi:hypothetical protein